MPDGYYLEVSSVGAEYQIDTLEELNDHLDKYLFINSPEYNGYGYLRAINNNELTIEVNLKGRIKKINIKYNELIKIRTAVKV